MVNEVRVWTTGIACWGDDTAYISGWIYGGREVTYLQNLFPHCVVRVDHYDPDKSHQSVGFVRSLFYTTDRVTSRYHNEILDPAVLPVNAIIYDYAHILNPISCQHGLRYVAQHQYVDYPIPNHRDLQLKVVYHGHLRHIRSDMLLRRVHGTIQTLYDRLYQHSVPMDGTVGLQELLPPLYLDQQRDAQCAIRNTMQPGVDRLNTMDQSDEKIVLSIIEILWDT